MIDNNQENKNLELENFLPDNEDTNHKSSEHEQHLHREVARYREEARVAQHERDVACAVAVQERDEAIAAARSDAQSKIINAELRTQALKSGIVDLDALKLANIDTIAIDADGNVHGIENVVELLREQKPYLFNLDRNNIANTTTSQTLRPPHPIGPSIVNARSLTREVWQIERERLLGLGR